MLIQFLVQLEVSNSVHHDALSLIFEFILFLTESHRYDKERDPSNVPLAVQAKFCNDVRPL
jgi:hypothetical protein